MLWNIAYPVNSTARLSDHPSSHICDPSNVNLKMIFGYDGLERHGASQTHDITLSSSTFYHKHAQ